VSSVHGDVELRDQLRDRLAMLLDLEPTVIGDDDSFADLGVDSMMRLELIALVEQRVGHEIREQDLPDLTTIGQVLSYVAALQPTA
jgi:acyl carrier protein